MKLMIVDDSFFSQMLIKKIIASKFPNIELILAESGEKAYEIFNQEKIDFIITDLLMKDMSGQELIRLIREVNNGINIVVHSSDIQKAVKDEISEFNVLDFINKPMNAQKEAALIEIIEECLNA